MDTGVELVGIKNGIGLFYEYSEEAGDIGRKEIPFDDFRNKTYACRNFRVDNTVTFNGQKFSSIDAMLQYMDSLMEADTKRDMHTKNGWYFL